MKRVKDFKWREGMSVKDLVDAYASTGFQSSKLSQAAEIILKMKREGVKTYFTFTSNMVTSGLRGLFAQLIKLGLVDVIVTTVGGLEEDVMKAHGEEFIIGDFNPDDVELHEKGINRVGNIFIRNESYEKFEDIIQGMLKKVFAKKSVWTPSELFKEIGSRLSDESSILYQAARKNVPVFCPAITDGAMGFHLYLFQQKNPGFMIDVVQDFKNILLSASYDDKKGLISLGGGVSKHHAILSCLLNGGLDYAVYLTTARSYSGSMSGATTDEAKSWGKIKDDSDAVTVIGDVSITFPLIITKVLDVLTKEGIIKK